MISISAEEINTLEVNVVSGNYSAIDVDRKANIRGNYLYGEDVCRVFWNKPPIITIPREGDYLDGAEICRVTSNELLLTIGGQHICRVTGNELLLTIGGQHTCGVTLDSAMCIDQCLSVSHWTKGLCSARKEKH